MEDILVTLGICVVMPVMIVWLVNRTRSHELDKKTEVIIKAIENGQDINPEMFASPRKNRSLKLSLLGKLQFGIILLIIGAAMLASACFTEWNTGILFAGGSVLLAIGIAFIVMFVVGKKWMKVEIEAEEVAKSNGSAENRSTVNAKSGQDAGVGGNADTNA